MTDVHQFITSESVTEGHPDKICDQISDAVLDAVLDKDPYGRVACEALVTTGVVVVAGEITTDCYVDIPEVVRGTLMHIGYTDASYGFDSKTCGILTSIGQQSADIAMGVNEKEDHEYGAGDQGMMFGYACNETKEYMPLPIMLAHKLVRCLSDLRKEGKLPWLRPDGKSQVSVEYVNGKPKRITAVILSAQHEPDVSMKTLKEALIENVIEKILPAELIDKKTMFHINPTGRFVIGGPHGDTGVTGRKIIVDTYGGISHHGGGCFSGKDATKVDRSASYAARWLAKNIVAAGLAPICEIALAYAIGVPQPVAVNVDTYGTAKNREKKISNFVREKFKLSPRWIIERLKLQRPIYFNTAAYGHFGRHEENFTWEKLDLVKQFKTLL